MKNKIIIFLIFNISLCIRTESFTQLESFKDKKQCLPIFIFTAINGYKLYQYIIQKANDQAFFQALDVIKCLYMDYKCMKENFTSFEQKLDEIESLKAQVNLTQSKQKCIEKNLEIIFENLQLSVANLLNKNVQNNLVYLEEAMKQLKKIAEC